MKKIATLALMLALAGATVATVGCGGASSSSATTKK